MLPQLLQGGQQQGGGSPGAGQFPNPNAGYDPTGGAGTVPQQLPRYEDMPLGEPSLRERQRSAGGGASMPAGADDLQPLSTVNNGGAGQVINDPLQPGDPTPLAEPGLVEDELTSALDALQNSARGRQALSGRVRANGDGSYEVDLPGEDPVNVTPEGGGGAKEALEQALGGKRRARGGGDEASPLGPLVGKPTKVYKLEDLSVEKIEELLSRSIQEDAPALLKSKKALEDGDDLNLLAKTTYSLEGKVDAAKKADKPAEPEPLPEKKDADDLDDWDKEDWDERKKPVVRASDEKDAKDAKDVKAAKDAPVRFRLKSPLEQSQLSRPLTAEEIKKHFFTLEVVEW